MPQIAQLAATYSSQIFWMAVVFGLIYFGIGRAMLPKIEATVDMRDQRIGGDLAAAKAAREAADATEATYRAKMDAARADSMQRTATAKADAAKAAEVRIHAADAKAEARAETALAGVRAAQADALTNIEDVAAEAAQDIVARVSGLTVDRAAAADAVRGAMAQG